jgi:hypothetical protein
MLNDADNQASAAGEAVKDADALFARSETRLDYEDNPEGDPKVDRTDPLEMCWDSGAKKRNLVDGRRLAHIRRNVPIDEARALPG